MPDFHGGPVDGSLDVRWVHGRRGEPPIQVHAYDQHTFVLRQSKAVHYEGPFLYLFIGNERALLLDTGATSDPAAFPLRDTVDAILGDWLAAHPSEAHHLVVAHTHAHGDHIAGDAQFLDRPHTTVVGTDLASVRSFFGMADWPDTVVPFDLGGRTLEIVGGPGHHETAIAVYDPWSGFLVTGDTVYPGRLYVRDADAFAATLTRLVEFASTRTVTQVMGCHIEMTDRPRRDYPIGTTYQPHEPPLPMTLAQLTAVRDAAVATADRRGVHRHDDFAIFNGPCVPAVLRQLVRANLGRLRRLSATRWFTRSP